MVYDRVVADLNAARLRETSHPVFHALIEASLSIAIDVMSFPPIPKRLPYPSQHLSRYPNR